MHTSFRARVVPVFILVLLLFTSFATALSASADDGEFTAEGGPTTDAAGAVTITSGTAYAPSGGIATLPTTETPPQAPTGGYPEHIRPPEPPLADDPGSQDASEAPLPEQTQPATEGAESPQAPNDFRIFRNTTLNLTANQTSTTDEPSVAHVGNTVFMTGNWWAAISRDGGAEFTHVDPFTAFGGGYGGFCCDQVAIYSPVANATVWVLQYSVDGNGNNAERIAVSVGEPNLQNVSFFFADMTPQQLGQPNGIWADFPHVAVNSGFFWITYNMFNAAGNFVASAVNRVPLADLTNGGGFGYQFFTTTLGTTLPVSGAGSTMYIGTHLDTDTLRIWSWADSSNSLGQNDVNHVRFNSSSYVCTTNDGFDPCGRASSRVRGGWVGRGVIGFTWDAGQGDDGWAGTFAYPYTFVLRINQSNFSVINQPILWNGSFAWFYGGLAANGRGDVGLSIAIAGGATYPGSQIFVMDDVSSFGWQGGFFVASSTNSPASNRWGDYLTTRAINGNNNAWVGASYALVGACVGGGTDCDNVRVHYTVFGRERDYFNCPDDNYEWDNDWSRSTFMTPTTTSFGHAFCSSDDQDWFRFTGEAGNRYRIETMNLTGGNDTVIELYNSGLGFIAADDDGGPEFRSSLIEYITPTTGTYYIKARRFAGVRSHGYGYNLRITRNFPPVVTNPVATIVNGQTLNNPSAGVYNVAVREVWTASDSPEGIASQQLQLKLNAGAFADVSPAVTSTQRSYTRRFVMNDVFQYQVRATDTAGAYSQFMASASRRVLGYAEGRTNWTYTGTWATVNNASAWQGRFKRTAGGTGTKATFTFFGNRAALVIMSAPSGGKADIFIDGVMKGTVDFYSPSPEFRKVVFVSGPLRFGSRTLEIRWRTDKNPASTGRTLFIDGVVTLK